MVVHSELNLPLGEEPEPATLSENVRVGRLEGLRSLRDTIAREIQAGPPKWSGRGPVPVSQTAPLARQLRDVLKDIAEIEAMRPEAGSIVDELTDRRRIAMAAQGDVTAEEGRR